ncbi:MAG: TIGR00341 family protein [Candidatus Promineifilaceae bacterium]
MNTISSILRDNRFTRDDVTKFEQKLFFEGPRSRPYLERFFTLLILATIIATAGVLGDSTATVIGAMIIAPLMTPIMATTTGIITGNMTRALNRFLLVVGGVFVVIALSMVMGALYQGVISFSDNSQITSRISPRMIDLVAALASGAAGAFCLSRDDIADSLPGVAISISLVPPLCVVGISISAGQWSAAGGAFLLFMTNFLAILLAGGAVLAVLCLNSAALNQVKGTARRNTYAVILLAVLLVSIPLIVTGRQITQQAITEIVSRHVAEEWASGSGYHVRQVQSTGNSLYIAVLGSGDSPSTDELFGEIETAVGRPLDISLEMLPSRLVSNQASP